MSDHVVSLTVNGEPQRWIIEPGEMLLDALRRHAYWGVKRGCETGECGACAVLVDGEPINSCLMFAAQAEGQRVLTVEGLARDGHLDPLQEAFLDHGAVQCGYCTPAMLLCTRALLERPGDLTEADVREALSGVFCRCTGFKKPVEAVLAAAKSGPDAESRPASTRAGRARR